MTGPAEPRRPVPPPGGPAGSTGAGALRRPGRLVVATRNPGKLVEIRAALAALACPLDLLSLEAFPGAPEVAETGATYRDNARLKAESAWRATGLPALGDDTGLEVDALDGLPGLDSAIYAGPQKDAAANCRKLLTALAGLPPERRTARFRCLLVLAEGAAGPAGAAAGTGAPLFTFFEGVVEGLITDAPRGGGGFGYDPVFLVAGTGRTMAELSLDEKNRLSHRGRALAVLARSLAARPA